jgi:hypothetical protein
MFEVYGAKELMADIKAAGDIPADVLQQMVERQAKPVEEALVFNAASMLTGPYYEGSVATSVKAGKPRVSKGGATVKIEFKGTQHGNRLGEIAFINEYGKKSQTERPFIAKAITDADAAGAEAAKTVLDAYLAFRNL